MQLPGSRLSQYDTWLIPLYPTMGYCLAAERLYFTRSTKGCLSSHGCMQDAGGAAGDGDFDDDFMIVAPSHSRQGGYGASQQPAASMMGTPAATFRATQPGFTAATGVAAGPAAGLGHVTSSGPAVMIGGGLAGFSGATVAGLGNPSAVLTPALLAQYGVGSRAVGMVGSARCQPGFAVGGLGEGLSGLGGAEGAGLRVFAALSPAYADTAQALMRLWKHMAGLTGWAPPDALLQAVVEVATTAVCAGKLDGVRVCSRVFARRTL